MVRYKATLLGLPLPTFDIEIGAFLVAVGTGPEKQELLRLIGTLV